jgi:hypothetical protein
MLKATPIAGSPLPCAAYLHVRRALRQRRQDLALHGRGGEAQPGQRVVARDAPMAHVDRGQAEDGGERDEEDVVAAARVRVVEDRGDGGTQAPGGHQQRLRHAADDRRDGRQERQQPDQAQFRPERHTDTQHDRREDDGPDQYDGARRGPGGQGIFHNGTDVIEADGEPRRGRGAHRKDRVTVRIRAIG